MAVQATQSFANLTSYTNTMNDINRARNELEETKRQISSGKAAQTFEKLSDLGITEGVIDNESRITILEGYLQNNEVIKAKLDTMDLSLDNLIKQLTEFRGFVVQKRSSSGKFVDLKSLAKSVLAVTEENLNVKFQGKYVFSGSRVNIKPVNGIIDHSNVINNRVSPNYYRGDAVIETGKIADNFRLVFGVTADNKAFQNTIGALHKAIEAGDKDERIKEAYDLTSTAINDLIDLRSTVRYSRQQVTQISDNMKISRDYYYELFTESLATKVEEASVKLNRDMEILMGTYQAYGKLSKLSLTNYL
ncbi:flagellin N-terminal helical domain-containing protein [Rickettsiales endosymbiont of Stachyamoeba lipophora]|uniref:flagellin N-terminal helical domain-containing protein n=1 Tax=Rickettsiales endosymbiont of Stachyamoeba lipophora TaxID=2486578 RepID=UPI000F64DAB4|nr:hypothetical protein [Rickettsiales endosymbiont of Stachyamoeba lipophora]AZL16192.1 hypothetical protein EF513_06580 [Rickettsiales endosymbiont of Stachyamoeba lipophora]